ncbi:MULTISPECIES: YhjD/YihY/BrkB family envelope integrity protein [Glaesserella]|nr:MULTISPECIES: YhjD/YihY/BrkB family envelope integrity protein [Glaesserella]
MFTQTFTRLKQYPIQLYATSLTYYSLIALVPLLSFWLGLLEKLGIDDLFHTVMHGFLEPMGQVESIVGSTLFEFVHNTHKGLADHFTVSFFFLAILFFIYKIDNTINQLWRIKSKLDWHFVKTWGGMFLLILLFSALLFAIKSFPKPIQYLCNYNVAFTLLIWIFFTLPRTKIHLKAALCGSLCCLVGWLLISRLFQLLIYWNDTYLVVFHDFVGMMIMLLWINLLWVLLLTSTVLVKEMNKN